MDGCWYVWGTPTAKCVAGVNGFTSTPLTVKTSSSIATEAAV